MVTLKYLATSGNGASLSRLAADFQIGKGTVRLYFQRTFVAIMELKPKVLAWPNDEEKAQIALRISRMGASILGSGFKNCIGFIDGTLSPLETKPVLNGSDYYCRNACYAVTSQMVCDDHARIRSVYTGWPGSTHDNRSHCNS